MRLLTKSKEVGVDYAMLRRFLDQWVLPRANSINLDRLFNKKRGQQRGEQHVL